MIRTEPGRCVSHLSSPRRVPTAVDCLIVLTFLSLGSAKLGAQTKPVPQGLMPVPSSLELHEGELVLNANFRVALSGFSDDRLRHACDRTLRRIEARTGLGLSRSYATDAGSCALVIKTGGPGMTTQGIEEDESYTLDISKSQITLGAPTVVGTLRGLETIVQLLQANRDGYFFPCVHVEDRPRFPWRGLLLDPARHWLPVEVVERNLDAMAMVKLNVLHWHLSDDEGFRVESRRYPRLQQNGSDGLYYTQDQIREVVSYARDRGIRVVPEFDMPGHATSWFVGYPVYASAPGPYVIARSTYDIKDPAFDPTREEVYKFIEGFVGEMAPLFPDAYWHIGGDEVNGKQWDANTEIQMFKARHGFKDNAALQAYFNQRLMEILKRHGKQMVGWDEILNPNLPRQTVVQSWRDQALLVAAAKQGFRGILSAGYYLDAMETAGAHYAVDPLPQSVGLDPAEAARILGGEACMWGEYVTPENIDSRIWPLTAAIAERLWSKHNIADTEDMYRRLQSVSVELESSQVRHLTGPDLMLRRLAGGESIGTLRKFQRLVEPLSAEDRFHERNRPDALTPLVTVADIAIPDAPGRREVEKMVDGLLGDAPRYSTFRDELKREFTEWVRLPLELTVVEAGAPLVRDADSSARILADLGTAGLEALAFLCEAKQPPKEWTQNRLSLLHEAAQSHEGLRIPVEPALRKLITASMKANE